MIEKIIPARPQPVVLSNLFDPSETLNIGFDYMSNLNGTRNSTHVQTTQHNTTQQNATQHNRATQQSNTTEQHHRAKPQSNTTEQYNRATQESNTTAQNTKYNVARKLAKRNGAIIYAKIGVPDPPVPRPPNGRT